MIYVMLNKMVFRVSDCELYASDSWRYVLRRHISYFADEQGLNGLLKHIGEDNPFYGQLIALTGDFNSGNPRMPFEAWEYVDPEFRDLVGKMTNLDPTRRITARQALEHSWFSQAIWKKFPWGLRILPTLIFMFILSLKALWQDAEAFAGLLIQDLEHSGMYLPFELVMTRHNKSTGTPYLSP